MRDYWNDPPDDGIEVLCPKCGDPGDYVRDDKDGQVFVCSSCEHEWKQEWESIPDDHETEPLDLEEMGALNEDDGPKLCPHGNEWAECNACMVASDFAYDAARERGR